MGKYRRVCNEDVWQASFFQDRECAWDHRRFTNLPKDSLKSDNCDCVIFKCSHRIQSFMFSQTFFLTRYLSDEVKFAFSPFSAVHCVDCSVSKIKKWALIFTLQREYFHVSIISTDSTSKSFLFQNQPWSWMESKKFNNEFVQCALCVVKNSGISGYTGI